MVNYGRVNAVLTPRGVAGGQLNPRENLKGVVQPSMTPGGTSDYNQLINHPSINEHELVGNKNGNELGLINSDDTLGLQEIDRMFAAVFGL